MRVREVSVIIRELYGWEGGGGGVKLLGYNS